MPKGCRHSQRHMLYTAASAATATAMPADGPYAGRCYLPIFGIPAAALGILITFGVGGPPTPRASLRPAAGVGRAGCQARRAGLEGLEAALRNATPIIEVKPRRVGGATYQVPVEIRGDRRLSLGVRWLVQAARKRNGKSMSEKLASEFVDASNGLGAAVKRSEDTHKMAEANKDFRHFKW